jgi:four helix bundle protein
MDANLLKNRTKPFGISVIKFVESLNINRITTKVIANQLIRAATSVGSNYRAACRARSRADFISKMTIIEEESDECSYWLEMLHELNVGSKDPLNQ